MKHKSCAGAATYNLLDIPQVRTSHFGEFSVRFRNGYLKVRYNPDSLKEMVRG